MFTAKVPEKLIKSVPGHKSSQALQVYEWPTVTQKQAVSRPHLQDATVGGYLQELQNNQLYVWCNLPHYVLQYSSLLLQYSSLLLQYSSLLLQYSNLPQLCNLDYLQLRSPSIGLYSLTLHRFSLLCLMALATAQHFSTAT